MISTRLSRCGRFRKGHLVDGMTKTKSLELRNASQAPTSRWRHADAQFEEGKDFYFRRYKGYEPPRDLGAAKSSWITSRTKIFGSWEKLKDARSSSSSRISYVLTLWTALPSQRARTPPPVCSHSSGLSGSRLNPSNRAVSRRVVSLIGLPSLRRTCLSRKALNTPSIKSLLRSRAARLFCGGRIVAFSHLV